MIVIISRLLAGQFITMKVILVVLLLAVAAYGQEPHEKVDIQKTIAALLERANGLITTTKEVLKKHEATGILLSTIERELAQVEQLADELEKQKAHIKNLYEVHAVEEELLYHENRLMEEIAIVEDNEKHHHHHGHTKEELIKQAEDIVDKARTELSHHLLDVLHWREVTEAREEIIQIERLEDELRNAPEEDLKHYEMALARHEKTLNNLINRLKHHK